jgi:hypothetical protein
LNENPGLNENQGSKFPIIRRVWEKVKKRLVKGLIDDIKFINGYLNYRDVGGVWSL